MRGPGPFSLVFPATLVFRGLEGESRKSLGIARDTRALLRAKTSGCRKRGVESKGGSLHDGFGGFDGFGGSGVLLLVPQNTEQ